MQAESTATALAGDNPLAGALSRVGVGTPLSSGCSRGIGQHRGWKGRA